MLKIKIFENEMNFDVCPLLQLGQFRGIEYSASVADFFDDINMRPAEDWHPKIPNVVYWGTWQILHFVEASQQLFIKDRIIPCEIL